METISEHFGINELTEVNISINFNIIELYIFKYPELVDKLKSAKYKYVYFCGGRDKILFL